MESTVASQGALLVKGPRANAGDREVLNSTPGSERSPGGRHGNPAQYSGLENPTDRGVWQATVHRVTELDLTEGTKTTVHVWTCM